MLEKRFMLARFCSRSKPLEGFSAQARLGLKIDSVIFARARLGSKIFMLGSLELEKFTLVPNTSLTKKVRKKKQNRKKKFRPVQGSNPDGLCDRSLCLPLYYEAYPGLDKSGLSSLYFTYVLVNEYYLPLLL